MSRQTFTYDVAKALTANGFSRTGYTYQGWATSASGSKVYDNQQSVINLTSVANGTFNLYAFWLANTYYVDFNGNGADGGSMSRQTFTYNIQQQLKENAFTRTGHRFEGWDRWGGGFYTDKHSVINLTADPNGIVSLYAHWQINQYLVTFDANGGEGGWSENRDYGSIITAPTVTRTGHTFTGWSPEVAATVPANNVTYTAQWTAETPPTPTIKTYDWTGTNGELNINYTAAGGWGDDIKVFNEVGYYGINLFTAKYTLEADFVDMRHKGVSHSDGDETDHTCFIGARGVKLGDTMSPAPSASSWHFSFCEINWEKSPIEVSEGSCEFSQQTGTFNTGGMPHLEYNKYTGCEHYRIAVNFNSGNNNRASFHIKCTFELPEAMSYSMNVGDKFDIYFYLSKDTGRCGGYTMQIQNAKLTCVTTNG